MASILGRNQDARWPARANCNSSSVQRLFLLEIESEGNFSRRQSMIAQWGGIGLS